MLFGEKTDADGTVDFDKTYEYLIKEAIEPGRLSASM